MGEVAENRVILYSTGCPKCKILAKKLDEIGVLYTVINDVGTMLELGISTAPVLSVDDELMDFNKAIGWVRQYKD
jgi:glutaredoxin